MPTERDCTARHEAAHAVALWHFGVPFHSIQISGDGSTGGALGVVWPSNRPHVPFFFGDLWFHSRADDARPTLSRIDGFGLDVVMPQYEATVMISLAGSVAEAISRGVRGGECPIYSESDFYAVVGSIVAHYYSSEPAELRAEIIRLYEKTRRLLKRRAIWRAIVRIGDELTRKPRGRMNGRDVRRLLRQSDVPRNRLKQRTTRRQLFKAIAAEEMKTKPDRDPRKR